MKQGLALLCLLISGFIYGQSTEGSVQYQKTQRPAAVIELPFPPDVVNAALDDYLSRKGKSRGNDLKGFTTFRNTQLSYNDSTNADLYFKVERKSRQEKGRSIVSLLLTQPREGDSVNTRYLSMDEAKAYLNDLLPAIQAYDLEVQIKDQNDRVIKSESKYKSLADDGTNLEKKKEGILKDIENNRKDTEAQMNEVQSQKQKLAALVSQRRG